MKLSSITRIFATVAVGAMTLALALPASASPAAPPDNQGPTVNINNAVQEVPGALLSTGSPASVTAEIAWQQYDVSGICYEYGYLYDNYEDTQIGYFDTVQTSVNFTATQGHYYELDLYTYDCSPNENGSETTQYFDAPSVNQEGSATFSPGWKTSNCNCFSGGTDLYNTKVGATATYQYSGYGIGFVTEKASNRGTAKIYIDGVLKLTLNAKTNTAISSVVGFQYYHNSYGTHTIKIVIKSGRIDVDAFLVS